MKRLIIFFSFITLLAGCVKKADIDLPKSEKKLVMICYVSPDEEYIDVMLRLSVARYNNMYLPRSGQITVDDITDATIYLSDGSKTIRIPFDSSIIGYRAPASQMPVVRGRTYTLTASTPDGKEVSATTTVPEEYLVTTVSEPVFRTNTDEVVDFDLSVVANDIPGKTTYVGLYALVETEYAHRPVEWWRATQQLTLGDDARTPKTNYTGTLSHSEHMQSDTLHALNVRLGSLNCSREFYLFAESVQRGLESDQNPFAEPVLVYSNVNNGFGCFGAYTAKVDIKKIK